MNRKGDHFLPGARFTLNENRGVHRRHHVNTVKYAAESFVARSNQVQSGHLSRLCFPVDFNYAGLDGLVKSRD